MSMTFGLAYGQRVMKDISRIPSRLDPPETLVVLLVVQHVPRHSRRVERWIRQIRIGMIDQRAIVSFAGNRRAAGLREQIAVKRADPRHVLRLVTLIQPPRRARE